MRKRLLTVLFLVTCFVGYGQMKTGSISQPTTVTAKLTVLSPKGTLEIPNATLSTQALPKGQADALYAPKTVATSIVSGLMSNTDKARFDSITSINNGTEGQTLAIVSGVPAWTYPTKFATTTSTNNYTGQTLQNIPGLTITLAANSTYEFEACLICGVSADVTGAAFTVNYNGGAGADMSGIMEGSVSPTTYKSTTFSVLGTAVSGYLTSSSLFGGIRIKGIITTGTTSQPFTVQDLKTTSGTISIYKKSYLKVTLIP